MPALSEEETEDITKRDLFPALSLLSWQAPAVLTASSISSSFGVQWPGAPQGHQLLMTHPFLGEFYNRVLSVRHFSTNSIPQRPCRAHSSCVLQWLLWNPVTILPTPTPTPTSCAVLHKIYISALGSLGTSLGFQTSAWGTAITPSLLFLFSLLLASKHLITQIPCYS